MMRRRRRKIGCMKQINYPVKLVCIILALSFAIIQIFSLTNFSRSKIKSETAIIGELGETVIEMLPKDLAFTLFLPSEEAIRRDLRLDRNDTDSDALLTRVLGFAAVPRWISSAEMEVGKQKLYDSISGFRLHVSKDLNGMVVVNGVVSERVDLKMGKILVHVMNGVVMDSEFEQSVQGEDEDDEGDGLN